MTTSVAATSPASASGAAWYAYVGGGASAPTNCPATATTAEECTFGQALSMAGAGDDVYLATPGATGSYIGNWTISPTGTSASAPLTIGPAPGVTNPILDGNEGSPTGCTTSSCGGPVITIGDAFVNIDDVTIENARNTGTNGEEGGGVDNNAGGSLSVTGSAFLHASGDDGGAIDNADSATGTLNVSDSTFSDGNAVDGGAIDNGDNGGHGTLIITGSTFSGGNAQDGGAIDNADQGGHGTVTVTSSTFSNNGGIDGGAIDNGDETGTGTLIVTSSTFSGSAADGAAIDNGDYFDNQGSANDAGDIVWAAANVFNEGCAQVSGTWDDEGYNVGSDGTCMSSHLATGDINHGASLTSWLGPLTDNGGLTETIALLGGNPAIDVVPNSTSVSLDGSSVELCPTTDQRGVQSPTGAACDAGAVQLVASYAYASGGATSPTNCPETATVTDQCTLAQALSLASAGGLLYLATGGASGHYIGNWGVNVPRTSASAPVTIEPAPGVTNPTLDGNHGSANGCTTSTCNGPVLQNGIDVYLDIDDITFENADNTSSNNFGGGLDNGSGGNVSITGSTFSGNSTRFGGAISNGNNNSFAGSGTLSITGSTFSGNSASYGGGAIFNGGAGGSGALTVSGSTFSDNSAAADGGAIDNADEYSSAKASITGSTFSGNNARAGGAIDTGDQDGGNGTLNVTSSTFSANSGTYGGAIDNGAQLGSGTTTVTTSTFSGNSATDGGGVDNGDVSGHGNLSIASSTFSGNSGRGAIVDNGDNEGSGTVWAGGNIFNGSCAQVDGTWYDQGYNVGSNGSCFDGSPVGTGDNNAGPGLSYELGPLAANGGPTQTIALVGANPAINLVPNSTTVTLNSASAQLCPTTDQRGVASSPGAACDAGAVQLALPAPVAADQSYQTTASTPLDEPVGSLQVGVADDNSGSSSWTSVLGTGPGHGTVTVHSDGSFTYTPDPGFAGADSFTYRLTDNLGLSSAPATVTISVAPVFSVSVDGASSPTTVLYATAANLGETGVPASATGTLTFSTSPGGLPLCSLTFPTASTGCQAPTDLAAGVYTVTASFADATTDASSAGQNSVQLTVSAAPVVASIYGGQVYGASNSTLGYTDNAPSGVTVTGSLTCSTVNGGQQIGPALAATSYTVDSSGCSGLALTGTASTDYSLSYTGLSDGFVVTPAPLTVTASSGSFTYGGTAPTINAGYDGFVNSDSPSSLTTAATCSLTATSSSPVGAYTSSCSGAADPNYAISYVPGSVDVTPAPLTVTAPSPALTYGGTVPAVTATYSGFIGDDSASSLTTAAKCSTTATSSSSPGTYLVSCSGAVDPNYVISYAAGTVTVSPAPLTVVASSTTFTYGGAVPAITPSYAGFVDSDNAASLTTAPECSTTATSSSPPASIPLPAQGRVTLTIRSTMWLAWQRSNPPPSPS